MIKDLMMRGSLPAPLLAALPLLTTAPACHVLERRQAAVALAASSPATPGAPGVRTPLSLFIRQPQRPGAPAGGSSAAEHPIAVEHRDGPGVPGRGLLIPR
ncbi:hypothetical protein ACIA98_39205 [Streptomyces sp. NPDC051366]|uniref:hypothetical protein n=1 Tax=Streptomyces sp. NPDC051366 TaxID=3365652 RepID=UPI003789EBF9